MKILIDTNVIIDFYEERASFIEAAEQTLLMCAEDKCIGTVCASSITDIHYLLSKSLGKETALECVKKILDIMEIADVGRGDIHKAALSGMSDFEDAVVAYSAKRAKADFIVTRNTDDYEGSPIPAITPLAFLEQHAE